MAGIWELVATIPPSENQHRINVSLLETELTGYALGVRTKPQALATLESSLGRAFTGNGATIGTELGDVNKMADDFASGNVQSKLVLAHKIKWALNAAELQLTDEAKFRNVMDIEVV